MLPVCFFEHIGTHCQMKRSASASLFLQKAEHGYLVSNKNCCRGKASSMWCASAMSEAFVGRRWDQTEISTMVCTVGGP